MSQDLMYVNMSELNLMQAGPRKNSAIPAHCGRNIKASKNAVAQWYSRKSSGSRVDTNPLSSYGITPPYTRARLGH